MKTKPTTPYQRLLDKFRNYAVEVEYPKMTVMFLLPKDKLDTAWKLTDVWERTKAAEQLGYDVVVKADNDGLRFVYTKKRPKKPWNI